MYLVSLSFVPSEASLTGLASNVTGASWTLSATSMGDSLAHKVTIRNDSATDHSAKTATLVGTDADGKAQTESLSLPGSSATVTSTKYWRTLTSVTPSATIGSDTMDIGWSSVCVSQTVPLNYVIVPFAVSVAVVVSGTINYTVQHAFGNIYDDFPSTLTWFDHISLASDTTNGNSNYAFPCRATRLLVNSLISGATISFTVNQGYSN